VLYVFIVLAHHRRRVIHFNVTAHPASESTSRQLAEDFFWQSAPRYLPDDRDYFTLVPSENERRCCKRSYDFLEERTMRAQKKMNQDGISS